MHDMNGWGHWLFGGVWMVLFWGAVILLIALVIRWAVRGSQRGPQTDTKAPRTPLEILNERYARGEIDSEEFERRKRDLSEDGGASA